MHGATRPSRSFTQAGRRQLSRGTRRWPLPCRVGRLPLAVALAASGLPWFAPQTPVASAADDEQVVAVIACDGYADLKKQLGWLGRETGNPSLAGAAESMIMLATQGRGLAGLDVKRPLGIVITTDGVSVAGSSCIPVGDLDSLLSSLEGMIGPAKRVGESRQIALPAAGSADIVERDGWAIISPTGMSAAAIDPAAVLAPLVEDFTLAIEVHPSRLPEPLREQLAGMLEQLARQNASDSGADTADSAAAMVDGLGNIESMTLGLTVDEAKGRIAIENRTVALDGSAAASALRAGEEATVSMPLPTSAEPMLRLMLAQAVSPDAARQLQMGMRQAAKQAAEPEVRPLLDVLEVIFSGMASSGRLDATLAITTEGAAAELTGGARIQDGRTVELAIKKGIEAATLPKAVSVTFDSATLRDATLHTIRFDPSEAAENPPVGAAEESAESLGPIEITLAIAPSHIYLAAGGDVRSRLEGLLSGTATTKTVKSGLAIQVAFDRLLDFASKIGIAGGDLVTAAEASKAAPSSTLQLIVRPIERGLAWQVSADSGVVRALGALGASQGVVPAGGLAP